MRYWKKSELTAQYDLNEKLIVTCLEQEWIIPVNSEAQTFDQEDVARLLLINDLKSELGVNDEAVPIILDLIDQIHSLKHRVEKYAHSLIDKA
ncbi:MAG: hypothetical protein JW847_02925 [Candidatus Omnitrophica bacterium]|nr:hypothetical protein [Candidatus Omnitrophota bacterium]